MLIMKQSINCENKREKNEEIDREMRKQRERERKSEEIGRERIKQRERKRIRSSAAGGYLLQMRSTSG